MTSNRKRKKHDKKLLGECWMLDNEPHIKHYSCAYKHSHKYYAKCQKRYDGFSSIIKGQSSRLSDRIIYLWYWHQP